MPFGLSKFAAAIISTAIGAALLYAPYIWCRVTHTDSSSLGLFYDINKKDTIFTLELTAAILIALTFIALMWPWEALPRSCTFLHALDMGASGLAAALIEETFFRGFLQPLCARKVSPPAAVVLVNLVFAPIHLIVHPNWVALLVFFPGCIMGWLKYRFKNLYPPTLFHFLGNIWAIWFFPMPVNF